LKKLNTHIQELGADIKKVQKKIHNVEQQKAVVEYTRLKKETESMYKLLMTALETDDIQTAKNADAVQIERVITKARETLRKKMEELKSMECNEIISEANIDNWKTEINELRSEIVNIEIEITKLDSTLTTEDKLLKKYQDLKEEKKVILDSLACMNYIKTG
jgi:chromosome segregation ATPase